MADGIPRSNVLVGIAGVGLAAAPFLPWVHVFIIGNLDLMQLLSAAKDGTWIGYVCSASGAAIALTGFMPIRGRAGADVAALIVAAAVGLLGATDWTRLVQAVGASDGFGSLGAGALVAAIAVVVMAVGALRGLTRPTQAF